MGRLRVSVELNKGKKGIPLKQLASISDECQKLFDSLCQDVQIDIKEREWIAFNFENGSVCFAAELIGDMTDYQVNQYNEYFSGLLENTYKEKNLDIGMDTIQHYVEISSYLHSEEFINFGIHRDGNGSPEWHEFNKEKALQVSKDAEIAVVMPTIISYYGGIQGMVHSLYSGSKDPHFDVRDMATGRIVKCYYSPDAYDKVHELFDRADNVVFVSGKVQAAREGRYPISITVDDPDRIRVAERYQRGDLLKFFGCAPDILGGTSLTEFMDRIRADE